MKMERSLLATVLVIANILSSIASKHDAKCLPGDQNALLDLKKGLIDTNNTLSSWRGTDCCSNWWGIECDNITGGVAVVDLSNPYGLGLRGEIRPSLVHLKSLKHLDLSYNTFGGIPIPEFFGSLKNLKYLNLSNAGFSGTVPQNLGNLSNLQYLDVSNLDYTSMSHDLRWITGLVSLKHVMMNGVDLSSVGSNWLQMLNLLPHLKEVHLSLCSLPDSIPNLHRVNFTSLAVVDLSYNFFTSVFPDWLVNITSLAYVDLSFNYIQGTISGAIGSLCKLVSFDLSANQLTGNLPQLLEGTEACLSHSPFPLLETLSLSNNQLNGSLPNWLGHLKNLEQLSLGFNLFEGPLPASLGSLQNLVELDVSSNYLTGNVSEAHFSKLKMLKTLSLASNSMIIFDVDYDWLPPFQLQELDMPSVRLGPSFPRWLKSQHEIWFLDISNSSISGSIPNWFWHLSSNLESLNVSDNQLQGRLPRYFKVAPFAYLDFSFNLFEGFIPLPSGPIVFLDLSNNRFNGPIPWNITQIMPNLVVLSLSANQLTGQIPDDIGNMSSLYVLDLSRNNLTGSIPSSISNCPYLEVLDLGNNNLSGEIPSSIGRLNYSLLSLHLNDNSISGKLPSSLQYMSNLGTMDLGNNMLEGTLPPWLGEGFRSLGIMNLRSNTFSGEIAFEFSNLTSLQILDLSRNNLTGRIPTSLGDLRAMAHEQISAQNLFYQQYNNSHYKDSLVLKLKNQLQKFTKILPLMTAIDLSGNSLSGEFPFEVTKLQGLMVLDLSRNHISGRIPKSISRLRQLLSLDFSSNDLIGDIPRSMADLSFLGYLNLSNNHLSGEIPDGGQMSTFDSSSFEGNPGLCGSQLVSCIGENEGEGRGNGGENRNDDEFIDGWFYLVLGLGFAAGIPGPYIVLIVSKTWYDKYFDFLDKLVFKVCW